MGLLEGLFYIFIVQVLIMYVKDELIDKLIKKNRLKQ
ncbi:MAG: hypothetical protein K0R15_639 [Clostridiales bacterium]|jgi:hypothetical protein|nr:hypothetical protein [Clostridiales bacterium]